MEESSADCSCFKLRFSSTSAIDLRSVSRCLLIGLPEIPEYLVLNPRRFRARKFSWSLPYGPNGPLWKGLEAIHNCFTGITLSCLVHYHVTLSLHSAENSHTVAYDALCRVNYYGRNWSFSTMMSILDRVFLKIAFFPSSLFLPPSTLPVSLYAFITHKTTYLEFYYNCTLY